MISFLVKAVVALAVIFVAVSVYMTIKTQEHEYQAKFLAGTISSGLPDGFYNGSADFYVFSWKGKKFDKASQSGINVLGSGDKYKFNLSTGPGIRDTNTQTIKLDYNRPDNPFWLRPTLDEMTEIIPGEYIGKVHYRLIPFFPFSYGYFRMSK